MCEQVLVGESRQVCPTYQHHEVIDPLASILGPQLAHPRGLEGLVEGRQCDVHRVGVGHHEGDTHILHRTMEICITRRMQYEYNIHVDLQREMRQRQKQRDRDIQRQRDERDIQRQRDENLGVPCQGAVPPYQTDEDEDELDDISVRHGIQSSEQRVDDGHH